MYLLNNQSNKMNKYLKNIYKKFYKLVDKIFFYKYTIVEFKKEYVWQSLQNLFGSYVHDAN